MNLEIQQYITNIYDWLETNKDWQEVKHWHSSKFFQNNENYIIANSEIKKPRELIRRYLAKLSELITELEEATNKTKHVILAEVYKNKDFKICYEQYHKKTLKMQCEELVIEQYLKNNISNEFKQKFTRYCINQKSEDDPYLKKILTMLKNHPKICLNFMEIATNRVDKIIKYNLLDE